MEVRRSIRNEKPQRQTQTRRKFCAPGMEKKHEYNRKQSPGFCALISGAKTGLILRGSNWIKAQPCA